MMRPVFPATVAIVFVVYFTVLAIHPRSREVWIAEIIPVVLVFTGLVQALSGAVLGGLWLIMIGWFLSNAASASYRTLILRDLMIGGDLEEVPIHIDSPMAIDATAIGLVSDATSQIVSAAASPAWTSSPSSQVAQRPSPSSSPR